MTIVVKNRDDLERSGDVLTARKKCRILLVKNLAMVWHSMKSRIQSYDDRSSKFFFNCTCVVANCFDDTLKNRHLQPEF
jgi:hypothetical protein